VLHLKYRPNPRLATVMAGWLAEVYWREAWQATLVVPVPLGRKRLLQRGYNQAELVASELAMVLGLPAEPEGLRRVRETRSQVGLNTLSRVRNVEGAFEAHSAAIAGHTVLLVDDLYTTGATLSSCTQALISVGAAGVYALTVGRA
jgi:ComF family protein